MYKVGSVMAGIVWALSAGAVTAEVPEQRAAEIRHLLKHDCGSCHGMRLKGGLGPSLDPERLQALSAEQISATILYGRPGTPMPPWQPFLSEQEALWLAGQLKQGVEP